MKGQATLFHVVSLGSVSDDFYRYCRDCSFDVAEGDEWYMVRDGVWPVEPHGGVLCIGCLEARLGRTLGSGDFTDCPLNVDNRISGSERLQARLDGVHT